MNRASNHRQFGGGFLLPTIHATNANVSRITSGGAAAFRYRFYGFDSFVHLAIVARRWVQWDLWAMGYCLNFWSENSRDNIPIKNW